jgi:protein-S-isoprenylcysteine O-methyltransferase Ste14
MEKKIDYLKLKKSLKWGTHRFYVGKIFTGILQTAFSAIALVAAICAFIFAFINTPGVDRTLEVISWIMFGIFFLVSVIWLVVDWQMIVIGRFSDKKGNLIPVTEQVS